VAEWSIAPVLKTGNGQPFVSSNLTASASSTAVAMKHTRSPQDKKALSYAKDGRNTVAESRSKSRTAIAKRKASANRALRRAETVATSKMNQSADGAELEVTRTGRRSWRKIPDAPLAEYVDRTLERRTAGRMNSVSKSSQLLVRGKKAARPRRTAYKGPLQGSSDG
jgi:hypothetical protein